MARPAVAGPPDDVARDQIVARQYLHASSFIQRLAFACARRWRGGFPASDSRTTSPTTMIAGLITLARDHAAEIGEQGSHCARPFERAAFQHRDRHVGGDAVGHQLVGDQPAQATPI
jgi:hypothetical protein